ncbi:septation regulator SpoVG [Clostridium grantii]|uniref:septation regulator SpoVG n=1 Tax=Clostridium grantii TaxID=40575 RepID=UPI000934CEA3
MEIVDVKIRRMDGIDKMKAVASVNFEDEFVVHDIKVIEGKNGLFVVMPSKKISKDKFVDVAHPLKSTTRIKLQQAVIEAYHNCLKEEDDQYLEERMDSEFKFEKDFCRTNKFSELHKVIMEEKNDLEITVDEMEMLHNKEDDFKEILEENYDVKEIIQENEQIKKIEDISINKNYKILIQDKLSEENRILPGNDLFIDDLILDREFNDYICNDFYDKFKNLTLDFILAVDDINCILAYEVARRLGIKLILVQKGKEQNKGPIISVKYFSDKTQTLETLSLQKNNSIENKCGLFLNMDIKDSGLIDGVKNILQQFHSELKEIGTIIDYSFSHKEITTSIYSLFKYGGIDSNELPVIY